VVITFSLSTGLFYLTNILSTFFKIEGPFNNTIHKIVSLLIGVISNFLVFILAYYFGLSKKIAFKQIYIGALVAAIGWEAIKYIFIFYIDRFANYQLTYGSIASVIAFLLWVYISGLIFLLGAEINSIHKIQ
jgi:membrane protein